MTNLKVCKKLHIFIFISVIFITIGMAVGTICHFVANGFFNYGGEFASYKSITATYYYSENNSDTDFKAICNDAISGINPTEVTYAINSDLGYEEIVYKFSVNTDNAKLQAAVDDINSNFNDLSGAVLHEGVVDEGGSRNIVYASIALASAAAFQFIYYIIRYKLRGAFSALLAGVHNLGVYAALLAITRIPVGTEAVALGAAVVVVTMILSGLLFDRTRKNFKNEKYVKTDRLDVVEISASETRKITVTSLVSLAVVAVVLGVFATISAMYIGAFAPFIVALLGVVACFYGSIFFTPAVHSAIDATCEKVKNSVKTSSPKKQKEDVKEVKQAEENNQEKE
ncbi:MAG: hypothetical protein ACI4MN_00255 [Candidatus Coproplasma sp.]